MAADATSDSSVLCKGEYRAPLTSDLRSPCPIVNALANHGYIPRDGRNVSHGEIKAAMSHLGVSSTIRTVFAYGSYLEHQDQPATGFWAFIRNPFGYLLRALGLRDPGQRDSRGADCLNLDQLDRHNAVEHDVSLSRRDFAQGDNHTAQKDLVAQIVNASSDGKKLVTEDFARLRLQRLAQQKQDNPELLFESFQQSLAYGEVGLIQTVFGLGFPHYDVPVSYLKALFEEERLPVGEGWRKRRWWHVGFIELNLRVLAVKKSIARLGERTG